MSYCDEDDVKSILSEHGVNAFTDDDLDGVSDGTLVQDAIDRVAAIDIDFVLNQRYRLADLANNEWCRWANAILAACAITERRNMPGSESLSRLRTTILEQLKGIGQGARKLPGEPERFDHLPAVTNYHPERWRGDMPIRAVRERSTGDDPQPPVRRWPSRNFRTTP